jgi:hypothetical protein
VEARYYNEAIILGIIPLLARGGVIIWRWAGSHRSGLRFMTGLLLCLLAVNTGLTLTDQAKRWMNHDSLFKTIPRLVREMEIHNAVIFIPRIPKAPTGDYPFTELRQADIIYFRLGPAPKWGLRGSSWVRVYNAYFSGRSAYLFRPGNRLQGTPQSLKRLR